MAWLDLQEGILEAFTERALVVSTEAWLFGDGRFQANKKAARKAWYERLKKSPEKYQARLKANAARKIDTDTGAGERAKRWREKKHLQNTKEGLG